MKNFFWGLMIIGVISTGCSSDQENVVEKIIEVKVEPSIARKYIEENTFIDFDFDELQADIADSAKNGTRSTSMEQEERIGAGKAAAYRFYSHVEIKDSVYSVTVSSGEELNMSESLFKIFKKNLDDINEFIKDVNSRGEKVDLPDIRNDWTSRLLE